MSAESTFADSRVAVLDVAVPKLATAFQDITKTADQFWQHPMITFTMVLRSILSENIFCHTKQDGFNVFDGSP